MPPEFPFGVRRLLTQLQSAALGQRGLQGFAIQFGVTSAAR
jgi:hypothetical protein